MDSQPVRRVEYVEEFSCARGLREATSPNAWHATPPDGSESGNTAPDKPPCPRADDAHLALGEVAEISPECSLPVSFLPPALHTQIAAPSTAQTQSGATGIPQ